MLDRKITTVLFDLDGTLLPMDVDVFTNAYFAELAKKAAPYGYTDVKALVAAVWNGTKAMVQNDGTVSNCERFWSSFAQEMGETALEMRPVFDDFYAREFDRVKAFVGENPLARTVIDALKQKGYEVVLATNPIFPLVGVETRLTWLGLTAGDFSLVTSYENASFCKPNPDYYREILRKTGRRAEECMMVGNDTGEDLAAAALGMDFYLVTDCLIHRGNEPLPPVKRGSFQSFLELAELL